jgi:hypothetical protein
VDAKAAAARRDEAMARSGQQRRFEEGFGRALDAVDVLQTGGRE